MTTKKTSAATTASKAVSTAEVSKAEVETVAVEKVSLPKEEKSEASAATQWCFASRRVWPD